MRGFILYLSVFVLTSCTTAKYIYDNQEEIIEIIFPTVTEEEIIVDNCEHGRMIEWTTPQGKRVHQYEDGEFEGLVWTKSVKESWPGMSAAYKDKFPSSDIDQCEISCLDTRVDSWFDMGGRFLDDGTATKVPDNVHFYCRTIYSKTGKPAPYLIEFDYGNQRDAIWSLGGLHVLHGPEGDVKFRSQCHHGESEYKGLRTCLR